MAVSRIAHYIAMCDDLLSVIEESIDYPTCEGTRSPGLPRTDDLEQQNAELKCQVVILERKIYVLHQRLLMKSGP